jgi:hypothetical protein
LNAVLSLIQVCTSACFLEGGLPTQQQPAAFRLLAFRLAPSSRKQADAKKESVFEEHKPQKPRGPPASQPRDEQGCRPSPQLLSSQPQPSPAYLTSPRAPASAPAHSSSASAHSSSAPQLKAQSSKPQLKALPAHSSASVDEVPAK